MLTKKSPNQIENGKSLTSKNSSTLFEEKASLQSNNELANKANTSSKNELETNKNTHDKSCLEEKKTNKSKIVIHYDVGFQNHLSIRGKGANLSWSRGLPLKNQGPDEWLWETDAPFEVLEFKLLVNDNHYESGENHILKRGQTLHLTPKF